LDGDDTFNGLGGSDTFVGGKGDDAYVVQSGDTVTEQAGEGLDIIYTGDFGAGAGVHDRIDLGDFKPTISMLARLSSAISRTCLRMRRKTAPIRSSTSARASR
jgi:hypothetical protein